MNAAKISKVRFVSTTEKYTGPPQHRTGVTSWTPLNRERMQVHVTAGGIEQFLFDYYPDASTLTQADLKRMLIGVSASKALQLIQRRAATALPASIVASAHVRAYFGTVKELAEKEKAAADKVVDEVYGCTCWKFIQGYHHKPHEPHCAWLKTQPPDVVAREAARLAEGRTCNCGKFPEQWQYEHDMGAHKPDCAWPTKTRAA